MTYRVLRESSQGLGWVGKDNAMRKNATQDFSTESEAMDAVNNDKKTAPIDSFYYILEVKRILKLKTKTIRQLVDHE